MGEFAKMLGDEWTIDANSKEWYLSRVTQGIKARYEKWLETGIHRTILADRPSMLPRDFGEAINAFYEKKFLRKYTWGQDAWYGSLQSTTGICKLFALLLERKHPETATWSEGEFEALIDGNKQAFMEVLEEVISSPNSSTPGSAKAPSA